jgi:hypothetical protein
MDQLRAFHHLSSQVRILYNQSIVTFFFPIIFAPALCALLWEISDHFRLSESIHCSIYHYVKEYATLV